MPQVNISEAARLAGKDRGTIHRAIKAGRLSATLDATGNRVVDVAELQRVYGALKGDATGATAAQATEYSSAPQGADVALLQQQVARLQAENDRLLSLVEAASEERRQLLLALSPAVRNGEPQDTAQAVDAHAGTGDKVTPIEPDKPTFWQRVKYAATSKW